VTSKQYAFTMIVVAKNPARDVCQEKYLKDGLKLGADAKSSPKQERLRLANDSRNRIEQSCENDSF
jgi:hypothetical protein